MLVSVNQKSQITIPKLVRERLGIREGDVLELDVKGEEIVLRPRVSEKLEPRFVPVQALSPLVGVVAWGGDAVKDAERIYDQSAG